MDLFHVSVNPYLKTLTPRVPYNGLMDYNMEDKFWRRVCFAPSIRDCLKAIAARPKGTTMYVYKGVGLNPKFIKKPNSRQVVDSEYTNEYWYLAPCRVKLIAQIEIGEKFKNRRNVLGLGSGIYVVANPGNKYRTTKKYAEGYDNTDPNESKTIGNRIRKRIGNFIITFFEHI